MTCVSSLILIVVTGVGLGALYFLVASGLSLIYGLMHVLNFAHGAFLTAGAYAAWVAMRHLGSLGGWAFPLATLIGMATGAVIGTVVELLLIRPLYRRHIEQVLVTVGIGLMGVALFTGIWGRTRGRSLDPRGPPTPPTSAVRRFRTTGSC